jgi:hypothetical protein
MASITLDTLKYVKQLESAGVPAAQAEAFVNAQRDILSDALDTAMSTKADLLAVKSELKADIASTRSDTDLLRKDVESMEQRLTIKLGTLLAVAVASTAALVKML